MTYFVIFVYLNMNYFYFPCCCSSKEQKFAISTINWNPFFLIFLNAVSLRVVPNKLQFFEYETVRFYCEGVFHGNIVHKVKGKTSQCNNGGNKTAQGSLCIMTSLYLDDGGEHWCEIEGGRKSNSVNISVTGKFEWRQNYFMIVLNDFRSE